MKRNILLLATVFTISFSFLSFYSAAQTPNWIRVRSAGQDCNGYSNSIAVDASGNTYITGYFYSDTLTFGSITLTNNDNTGNSSDLFLAKFDANGDVLWAQSAGGANSDGANSIALDASGNIYVAGWFYSSSITFGYYALINADNTGNTSDLFVAKFNTNGNVIWAKSFGGADDDAANSVAVNAIGNVYLTGYFYNDTLTFGSTSLTNANGYDDIFLAKLDTSGNVIWANSAGGTDNALANSVVADASGNAYVAGGFYCDTLSFGSISLINDNAGYEDIVLAKYDSSGNVLWAKSEGGANDDAAYSVTTDASGNAYLTGSFRSATLAIGTSVLMNSDTTNSTEDIFLAKYNANGNLLWAKSAGGTESDDAYSVAVDALGNSYITGRFNSPVIKFGVDSLTNVVSTGISSDIFLAKYDAGGNVLWAKSAGGTDDDVANSIALNASGNIYITGDFVSTSCTFGNDNMLNDSNYYQIFVAKAGIGAGIKEMNNSPDISVYPDPNNGKFQVTSPKSQIQSLDIYNMIGEKVCSITNYKQQTTNEIDISSFLSGMYVIEVKTEKGIEVRKFIKEQ
ncbi:MAG: T9SS type A sorting domain-containing protein [Bacteroidales bacterium]